MTDGYKVKKIFLGEDLVWPKSKDERIIISASMSTTAQYYSLNLKWKPKQFTITYTSYHNSWWADQVVGVGFWENDWHIEWNCWDWYNIDYDRCWINVSPNNSAGVNIVQNKYQSTWTWTTVIKFAKDRCSIQQWNWSEVTWTPNSTAQWYLETLFSGYSNLKLKVYWTRSYLTDSNIIVDVVYE